MPTIADLLMAQGRQAADARRSRGGVWSSIVPQLANLPAQIMADQDASRAAQAEAQEAGFDRSQAREVRGQQLRAGQRTEDAATAAAEEEQAMAAVFASPGVLGEDGAVDMRKATALAQQQYPALVPRLMKAAQEFDEGVAKVALTVAQTDAATRSNQTPPPQGFTLNPGDRRFDAAGQQIAEVPAEEKPDTRSLQQQANDALRKGDTQGYSQIMRVLRETAAAGRDPRQPQGPRSPIWVMKDGQFIDLAGVAPPGSQPASSREQGRAVTSGDAGRFAELQTSLDDLKTLRATLFPDANLNTGDVETEQPTGTRAAIGAWLPNPITEATGIGAAAKQRQAVIDRVKQVIGKALEGGVLRKEDELKYERILPTIRDVPSVVQSKLDGLDKAIALRLQREIDARADAGYDVSKFLQRGATPPPVGKQKIGRFEVEVGP